VDQDGNVLDILVTSRRDAKAATRFFRKLLTGLEYVPRVLVTDKLASYGVARRLLMTVWVPKILSTRCDLHLLEPHRGSQDRVTRGSSAVLLRLSYLALTGMVTLLRLLPMSNTGKDIEILALRHQLAVLQRRVDKPRLTRPTGRFSPPCSTRSPDQRCASST
jgi:hypothetical protein